MHIVYRYTTFTPSVSKAPLAIQCLTVFEARVRLDRLSVSLTSKAADARAHEGTRPAPCFAAFESMQDALRASVRVSDQLGEMPVVDTVDPRWGEWGLPRGGILVFVHRSIQLSVHWSIGPFSCQFIGPSVHSTRTNNTKRNETKRNKTTRTVATD